MSIICTNEPVLYNHETGHLGTESNQIINSIKVLLLQNLSNLDSKSNLDCQNTNMILPKTVLYHEINFLLMPMSIFVFMTEMILRRIS